MMLSSVVAENDKLFLLVPASSQTISGTLTNPVQPTGSASDPVRSSYCNGNYGSRRAGAAFDMLLLDLIAQHPILYDMYNEDYSRGAARSKAWSAIREAMERHGHPCSESYIRKRFCYLRTKFFKQNRGKKIIGSSERQKISALFSRLSQLNQASGKSSVGESSLDEWSVSEVTVTPEEQKPVSAVSLMHDSPPQSYVNDSEQKGIESTEEGHVNELSEKPLKNVVASTVDPRLTVMLNTIGNLTHHLDNIACEAFKADVLGYASQRAGRAWAQGCLRPPTFGAQGGSEGALQQSAKGAEIRIQEAEGSGTVNMNPSIPEH